jgi:hypothetical protein
MYSHVSKEHTASLFRVADWVKEVPSKKPRCLLLASRLLGLLFDPDDGGDMFLRNVCKFLTDYTSSHPRRESGRNE